MLKTESIKIDGIEFKVCQFKATDAYKLKRRLAKIAAPFITGVLEGVNTKEKDILDSNIDMSAIGKAFDSILNELTEDEFMRLLRRMLEGTSCMYKVEGASNEIMLSFAEDREYENNFNMVFSGRTFTIYPLLLFILKVNYPDFFAKVGNIGKLAQTLMSKKVN
jgi:hypothetical protein